LRVALGRLGERDPDVLEFFDRAVDLGTGHVEHLGRRHALDLGALPLLQRNRLVGIEPPGALVGVDRISQFLVETTTVGHGFPIAGPGVVQGVSMHGGQQLPAAHPVANLGEGLDDQALLQ
jgi:hypothetical protein